MSAINVDETNNEYASVEGELLSKDKTTYIRCPEGKKSCLVPDTVTTVKEDAFSNCKIETATMPTTVLSSIHDFFKDNLKTVIITSGTSIEKSAFWDYRELTSITIPDSVTNIGSNVFFGCSSLENVIIPFVRYYFGEYFGMSSYNGSTSIRYYYDSITKRKYYYIPSSLRSVAVTSGDIVKGAFSSCRNLTNITISDNVTSIGEYAFYECRDLTDITFEGTKAQWNSISKGGSWDYDTGNYTVHCTDGDISK